MRRVPHHHRRLERLSMPSSARSGPTSWSSMRDLHVLDRRTREAQRRRIGTPRKSASDSTWRQPTRTPAASFLSSSQAFDSILAPLCASGRCTVTGPLRAAQNTSHVTSLSLLSLSWFEQESWISPNRANHWKRHIRPLSYNRGIDVKAG